MTYYPNGIDLDLFLTLAREAGRIQLAHVNSDVLDIEIKSDNTPVTMVDKSVNAMVIEEIRKRNRDVSIRGEEMSDLTDSDFLVILDPLDGTQPFIRREPIFTFCMALLKDGEPILSVTYNPSRDNLYHAERGNGAWLNGKQRLQVNSIAKSGGSSAPIVSLANWNGAPYHLYEVARRLIQEGFQIEEAGSIANSMTMVAEGLSCGTFFPAVHAHDSAPGVLLIEEAGGRSSSLLGNAQRYDGSIEGHLTSNGLLHDYFLSMIRAVNPL